MRTYFVEVRSKVGKWIKGAKRFESCRKAHTAARSSRTQPARVLMMLEPSKIKLPATV